MCFGWMTLGKKLRQIISQSRAVSISRPYNNCRYIYMLVLLWNTFSCMYHIFVIWWVLTKILLSVVLKIYLVKKEYSLPLNWHTPIIITTPSELIPQLLLVIGAVFPSNLMEIIVKLEKTQIYVIGQSEANVTGMLCNVIKAPTRVL